MSFDPRDFVDDKQLSNCCGAPIMLPDICSECKEHCEPESEEEPEPDYDLSKRPLTPLENYQQNDEHNVP